MSLETQQPELSDFQFEIDQALIENFNDFLWLEIVEDSVLIHINDYFSSDQKAEIVDFVRALPCLKDMENLKVYVADKSDRYEASEAERKDMQNRVRECVEKVVASGSLPESSITDVQVLWVWWTQILRRGFGVDATGKVIKVIASDMSKIPQEDRSALLLTLKDTFGVPAHFRNFTVRDSARAIKESLQSRET